MSRALLLMLWICLLPAGGWAADLMALESRHQQAPAAMANAVSDCHEAHGQPAAAPRSDMAQAGAHDRMHADGECSDCSGCEICHAYALAPRAAAARPIPMARSVPHAPLAQHTSTVLSPGLRPPIA